MTRTSLALACFALATEEASAERWLITPSLSLQETYSDNITLAPAGQERSDFVTTIRPGVSIRGTGARLRVSADYAYETRMYKDESQGDESNHYLNAVANAELWERTLFLDANASITQQDVSPFRPTTGASNTNLTGNRTEVARLLLSPYWLGRLGTFANFQARYRWDTVKSGGATSDLDNTLTAYDLSISSGPQFGYLGWSLAYLRQEIDYTEAGRIQDTRLEKITGTLRYRILPTVNLVGTAGYDDNNYVTRPGEKTSGAFWTVGAEWAPSERTNASASFGNRYLGNTKAFSATHRTRLTVWTITYSDDIVDSPQRQELPAGVSTTAGLDRLLTSRIPDPIERQRAVQTFISQSGLPSTLNSSLDFWTNQIYRSERFNASVGFLGVRASLFFNVFKEDRTRLSSSAIVTGFDPFALSDDYTQEGLGLAGGWRLSERCAATITLGSSKTTYKSTIPREDTDTFARIGVTYQIQRKVAGAVNIGRAERDSNTANSSYVENAISGSLVITF